MLYQEITFNVTKNPRYWLNELQRIDEVCSYKKQDKKEKLKQKFLKLREMMNDKSKKMQDPQNPSVGEFVVNQSSENFSKEQLEVIGKGLQYKFVPTESLLDQIIVNVDTGMERLVIEKDEKTAIRQDIKKVIRMCKNRNQMSR